MEVLLQFVDEIEDTVFCLPLMRGRFRRVLLGGALAAALAAMLPALTAPAVALALTGFAAAVTLLWLFALTLLRFGVRSRPLGA
jgi:type IV secretory pathway TrbD component